MKSQYSNLVFKVGGNFFEDSDAQKKFFTDIKELKEQGFNIAIVHGGGSQLQTQLTALGFESKKHKGLRVSPDEQMPAVTGVLAGTLNKQLVSMGKHYGLNGVGISLADGNLAHCVEIDPLLGAVGYPQARSAKLLHQLMHADLIPIICSIGSNDEGRLFNVNADQAATCIASLLYADLFFLSDVSGVLDANKQRIASLNSLEIEALVSAKVIKDGMQVKVSAAQEAANALKKAVTIGNWSEVAALTQNTQQLTGTEILPVN